MTDLPTIKRNRPTTFLIIVASLAVMIALGGTGWALKDRFDQSNARRAEQVQVNVQLRQISLALCREVEKLKTAQRSIALQQHRELRRNLRLLNLKLTPEIAVAAQRELDRTLKTFAPDACPRRTTTRR